MKRSTLLDIPKHKLKLVVAIDLLMKKEHDKDLTRKFIQSLIKKEPKEKINEFESLDKYGNYSTKFIVELLESVTKKEKSQSSNIQHLLKSIYEDKDIFTIVAKTK